MTSGIRATEHRKEFRYGLRLPVWVELADESRAISANSANISMHGILLHSHLPIHPGKNVKLAIAIKPPLGIALTATGTVLRLQEDAEGNYGVAVLCPQAFRLSRVRPAKT
jgi:PilZ domain